MHPLQRFEMPATPTTARRAKRATAPLDDAARARIAVLPSGIDSEHEEAALSSLVNEYLFEADATVPSAALTVDQDSDGEDDGDKSTSSASAAADVAQEIKDILDKATRSAESCRGLVADVEEAVNGLHEIRQNRSAFRRAVMSCLRDRGHDAGLCKLRWDKSSRSVAGSYEYIDVVVVSADKTTRFIVDVGFAAEFEVARPTAEFEAVRAALPEVLVAPADDARRVVKAASAAARRSLKSRGLIVPPWRKRRFMMAKWFGPYSRTVNPVPVAAAAAIVVGGGARAAICGTVFGFEALPPTAVSSGFCS